MSKYGMSDLSSVQVPTKGKNRLTLPSSVVDVFDWKSTGGKWVNIRLFGDIICCGNYWVATKNKEGKKTRFPVGCLSFNPRTGRREEGKYDPWWEVQRKEIEEGEKADTVQFTCSYYMNAIIRSEQENKPARLRMTAEEKKTGFKDKDSSSWTPVKVVRLSQSLLQKIQKLKPLNSVKFKSGDIKCYDVSNPKFGRDIMVRFDEDAAPANKYDVHPGDTRTPLTEEEQAYLSYDLDLLYYEPNEDEVKQDFEQWAKRVGYGSFSKKVVDETEDSDDDSSFDDEETPPKRKVSKHKEEPEDEDDDDTPVKPTKKSKKVVEEDDDFDDDFDDDEDDDPKPVKKKSKKVSDETEDDDFDDEGEDDDDEDSKPVKRKVKKPVEDDLDDEEEAKPVKRKPKKVVDKTEDDDFDDDDFDDDDDEEEEKPVPKKKTITARKKKVVEEDDDFDDDDF